MKIIDLLKDATLEKPQDIAIKSSTIELTYYRLCSDVKQLADFLKTLGCDAGVKVAVAVGNRPEYFTTFFAISAAGGTIVPLSDRMTIYEVTRYAERADVSIILTTPILAEKLQKEKINTTVVKIQYDMSFQFITEVVANGIITIDSNNSDVALMVHTSGTTGTRKIVMLTDTALIENMITYRNLMGFRGRDVVYCALPLHHIYCICAQILSHISTGDTFILSNSPFFIKDFLRIVETQKVSVCAFVPYIAKLLSKYLKSKEYKLKSMKVITISGSKMPEDLYNKLKQQYSHINFVNTYGMSEAGSRICVAAPIGEDFPAASVGRPIPGVSLRITGANGKTLPLNAIGEVEVKSSGIMKGYYNQPELTGQTKRNGWLKTGDLGRLDEEGNLFLVGRKKDIIICGGENIYPVEIEQLLLEHHGVEEASVVGVSNQRLQEMPYAFIVASSNVSLKTHDLIGYCRKRLSSFKVPMHFHLLDKLPRSGPSKIDKNKLKQIAESSMQVPS